MEKISLFRTARKILFGCGSIERLGEECRLLQARKALVVTDPGIIRSGLAEKVEQGLRSINLPFTFFSGVEPDPALAVVEKSLEAARQGEVDLIIGFGGGSSLDTAKITSVLLTNKGEIGDFIGVDRVPQRGIPTILIPTTAGTGSEVTPLAILSDPEEKLKKGIVSPHLFAEAAIVDPRLTLGLPPDLTVFTGMDALTHAIEACYSVQATSLTDLLAFRAMELIAQNLRRAFDRGGNLEARTSMMEASLLAGMAFANAGVAAVHAFSYSLGGEFPIAHGTANTLLLPHLMRFNIVSHPAKFARMARALGEKTEGVPDREAAERAVGFVERLADDLRAPRRMRDLGVPESAIPRLAEGALKVTRLLVNNPRRIELEDAIAIFQSAY